MRKRKKREEEEKRKFFQRRPNSNNNNNFDPSSFFSTSLHNYYSYNVRATREKGMETEQCSLHLSFTRNIQRIQEWKKERESVNEKKEKEKKEREIPCISFSTRVSFHRFHPFHFATQFQFSFHQPVYIFLNIKMGHSIRVYSPDVVAVCTYVRTVKVESVEGRGRIGTRCRMGIDSIYSR